MSCPNSGFFSLPAEQFTAIAALLGFLAARDLNVDQQNSLGNFLIETGQILVTIASQKELLDSQQEKWDLVKKMDHLQKQFDDLKCNTLPRFSR